MRTMFVKNRKGLTIIEGLIGTFLVSVMLICVLGTFLIARTTTVHARHRMVAMNLARQYLEGEVAQGYSGGTYAVAVVSPRVIDNVSYTIGPFPVNPVILNIGGVNYKEIGYEITWSENFGNGLAALPCRERAVTFVADHP